MLRTLTIVAVLAAATSATPTARAGAAAPSVGADDHHRELLERLELGMTALRELGRFELLRELERVADDVRREIDREPDRHGDPEANRERGVMVEQLEVLHMALAALREAGRLDAAELVERAIRAREVVLEGRRDREAEQLRRRQPGREQLREILGLAERLYREFGVEERAEAIARSVEELWRRPGSAGDRADALEQIEIMEQAGHAMLEAERRDAAELVERAIAARRVRLEGRRDAEARRILEREPSLPEQIELMQFGADLWERFGQKRKAEACAALAERLRRQDRGHGDRGHGEHGEHEHGQHEHGERGHDEHGEHGEAHERDEHRDRDLVDRMNALEEQIAELRRTIARLLEQRRR